MHSCHRIPCRISACCMPHLDQSHEVAACSLLWVRRQAWGAAACTAAARLHPISQLTPFCMPLLAYSYCRYVDRPGELRPAQPPQESHLQRAAQAALRQRQRQMLLEAQQQQQQQASRGAAASSSSSSG
jgi:hypothetical protein